MTCQLFRCDPIANSLAISYLLLVQFGVLISASTVAAIIGIGLTAYGGYGAVRDIREAESARDEAAAYVDLAIIIIAALLTLGAARIAIRSNHQARAYVKGRKAELREAQAARERSGMSLDERARMAHAERAEMNQTAQEMMFWEGDVQQIRLRQQKEYGNPNGPTYEQLLQQKIRNGSTPNEARREIIDGASKGNPLADKKFGN